MFSLLPAALLATVTTGGILAIIGGALVLLALFATAILLISDESVDVAIAIIFFFIAVGLITAFVGGLMDSGK